MLGWLNNRDEERVGLVFSDGTAVELRNHSEEPTLFFSVSPEDMIKYGDDAVATWHTHPRSSSNLSRDDYVGFQMWPRCLHIIIGQDGTRGYYVSNGAVLIDEGNNHSAWGAVRHMADRLSV